jgi:hypothetical protein
MTKPIEFVCKARPFGIIYIILGTAEESSLWRCGHSWVPDKLLLLLLFFWLLSKQPAAKVWHFCGIQAALTDSHGSCSHLLGLAFLCYFVEVVMMVNSVLSLLPMGSDETTLLVGIILHHCICDSALIDARRGASRRRFRRRTDGQTDGRIEHSRLF